MQKAATDSLDPPQLEAEAELHNLSALKLTVESLHYMRLATAAYGRVSLRPGLVGITDSNFTQLLCKHVGESLNPEEVRGAKEFCWLCSLYITLYHIDMC